MRTTAVAIVTATLMIALVGLFTGCGSFRRGTPPKRLGSPPGSAFSETVPMHCDELGTAARKAIRDFYEAGQPDSALEALEYWTDQCGVNTTTFRTSILLNMAAGNFSELLYDSRIIENLLQYRGRSRHWVYNWGLWWRGDEGRMLDGFTERIARELRSEMAEGSVERLLCDCFASDCDSLFVKLQQPVYAETSLRQFYEDEIATILMERDEANFAFYSGVWSPCGSAEQLGTHPILGAIMGGQSNGLHYNVVGEWRMGDAGSPYIVEHDGQVDTTTRFAGYYTGFELGHELVRSMQHQLYLRAGAGLDGFAYDRAVGDGPKQKVHSYNLNLGLAYRYNLQEHDLNYIGIEGVYNFVGYQADGGDELAGNTIGIRFLVGWGGNVFYNDRLRDLHYGH